MKNLSRSARKRVAKGFKVGDLVTWGKGLVANRIVEVAQRGVYVDVTDERNAIWFATRRVGSRLHLFVAFDRNNRHRSGRGPLVKV